ncbi:hypothetical protein BDZ45DRAFT_756180 [Acephala macrosclerotiorum]|nr:hypothetical protein BDZ45DRAFT_756180 [Acephala macrosclerotiorum]
MWPPPKLESAAVYELTIYQNWLDYERRGIYENHHPGLKSEDGDMLVVRFKYGIGFGNINGTPNYSPEREFLKEPWFTMRGADTLVLVCFEQYQLCFDETCMEWSKARQAIDKISHFLSHTTAITQHLKPSKSTTCSSKPPLCATSWLTIMVHRQ